MTNLHNFKLSNSSKKPFSNMRICVKRYSNWVNQIIKASLILSASSYTRYTSNGTKETEGTHTTVNWNKPDSLSAKKIHINTMHLLEKIPLSTLLSSDLVFNHFMEDLYIDTGTFRVLIKHFTIWASPPVGQLKRYNIYQLIFKLISKNRKTTNR